MKFQFKDIQETEMFVMLNTELFCNIMQATPCLDEKERSALISMWHQCGADDEGYCSYGGEGIDASILKSLLDKGFITEEGEKTHFLIDYYKLMGRSGNAGPNAIPFPKAYGR